jgi:cytidine deaminase
VLAEFCAPGTPVFFARLRGGRVGVSTVGELLPEAFGREWAVAVSSKQ